MAWEFWRRRCGYQIVKYIPIRPCWRNVRAQTKESSSSISHGRLSPYISPSAKRYHENGGRNHASGWQTRARRGGISTNSLYMAAYDLSGDMGMPGASAPWRAVPAEYCTPSLYSVSLNKRVERSKGKRGG